MLELTRFFSGLGCLCLHQTYLTVAILCMGQNKSICDSKHIIFESISLIRSGLDTALAHLPITRNKK